MRTGLSLASLATAIERAFGQRGAVAVALLINSPGGSPVQSSLISRRVRALAEEKKVPVYAFIEDVGASGGYWLACAADEIFADESSVVGSIGVITAGFGLDAAAQQTEMGVEEGRRLVGRQGFGLRREADDIGEHDREFAGHRTDVLMLTLGDQAAHQGSRYIGLEGPKSCQHGVEGVRFVVQFPDGARRQRVHAVQIQGADALGAGRQPFDRRRDRPDSVRPEAPKPIEGHGMLGGADGGHGRQRERVRCSDPS